MDLVGAVRTALEHVQDPELPLSVVDMGLIYDVQAGPDGSVAIDMTFTAMGCPAMSFLRSDVERAVRAVPGVTSVTVRTVWDPPWTVARLSERARETLRVAGVSV